MPNLLKYGRLEWYRFPAILSLPRRPEAALAINLIVVRVCVEYSTQRCVISMFPICNVLSSAIEGKQS